MPITVRLSDLNDTNWNPCPAQIHISCQSNWLCALLLWSVTRSLTVSSTMMITYDFFFILLLKIYLFFLYYYVFYLCWRLPDSMQKIDCSQSRIAQSSGLAIHLCTINFCVPTILSKHKLIELVFLSVQVIVSRFASITSKLKRRGSISIE